MTYRIPDFTPKEGPKEPMNFFIALATITVFAADIIIIALVILIPYRHLSSRDDDEVQENNTESDGGIYIRPGSPGFSFSPSLGGIYFGG